MSNSRRSPTPALAIALSCLCGLGAGLLWLRGCPQQPVISEPVFVPDLGQAEDDEETPVRELSGRVLLEPSEPGGALAPPKLGTCTASAWREGNRLAGPVDCDAEGRYSLTVDAPDDQAIAIEVLVPGRLRGLLESIGSEPVATVALGPASSVRGEVLDTRGRPLAGVLLEAMPTPSLGESEPWRVWSEADGTFVLDTIPTGHLNLRARHPGYAPTVSEVYAPEASVLVVLDGLLDLRGQIVGPPSLVSRATVRLEGSAIWPPIAGEVAQDGAFAFPGVLDGVYSLDAVVPASTPGDTEYASVPLENVPPDMFITLALIEAGRVPIEVVDPDGQPVAGARVVLRYGSVGMLPRMATTDEQGFASPGPVVPGPYLVQVDADGYLPAEPLGVDVRTDVVAERQTVQLLRPASITGRVVDGSGLSVADAEVLVESEAIYTPGLSSARASVFSALVAGGSLGVTRGAVPPIPMLDGASLDALGLPSRADDQRLRTTADGSFSLKNVPPGAYRLRARHDDYAVSDTRQVELKSGQQRTDVVLRLEDGTHFDGRVLDTNLQPIVGARVEFEDGTSVRTDAQGVFDGGYRRGRQRVIIRADSMVP
ncbi:MAG: carboxypeptidase regulatory-like domain-containing protein, partial [Nannocystaceae bacterium]